VTGDVSATAACLARVTSTMNLRPPPHPCSSSPRAVNALIERRSVDPVPSGEAGWLSGRDPTMLPLDICARRLPRISASPPAAKRNGSLSFIRGPPRGRAVLSPKDIYMKKLLCVPAALALIAAGVWSMPQAAARTPTVSWQGYSWVARSVSGNPGAAQRWSPSNVSIDSGGRLHLKVTRDKKGDYTQAELDTSRNGWGYGTYRWTVETDVSRLAPEIVLGLFTYGQDPAYGHREIDIEAAGWGKTPVSWEYTTWANGHDPVASTPAGAGASTQQIDWGPGHLTWSSLAANGEVLATASASGSDVPVPYDESIGINLWVCGCEDGWRNTPATEVVLSGFSFTPASVASWRER